MGVDWYPCRVCNETFPDCGDYTYCMCSAMLCTSCGDDMKKKYGEIETEEYGNCSNGCDDCQLPSSEQILDFALTTLGMTQEELVKKMDFKPPTAEDFEVTITDEEEEDDDE